VLVVEKALYLVLAEFVIVYRMISFGREIPFSHERRNLLRCGGAAAVALVFGGLIDSLDINDAQAASHRRHSRHAPRERMSGRRSLRFLDSLFPEDKPPEGDSPKVEVKAPKRDLSGVLHNLKCTSDGEILLGNKEKVREKDLHTVLIDVPVEFWEQIVTKLQMEVAEHKIKSAGKILWKMFKTVTTGNDETKDIDWKDLKEWDPTDLIKILKGGKESFDFISNIQDSGLQVFLSIPNKDATEVSKIIGGNPAQLLHNPRSTKTGVQGIGQCSWDDGIKTTIGATPDHEEGAALIRFSPYRGETNKRNDPRNKVGVMGALISVVEKSGEDIKKIFDGAYLAVGYKDDNGRMIGAAKIELEAVRIGRRKAWVIRPKTILKKDDGY